MTTEAVHAHIAGQQPAAVEVQTRAGRQRSTPTAPSPCRRRQRHAGAAGPEGQRQARQCDRGGQADRRGDHRRAQPKARSPTTLCAPTWSARRSPRRPDRARRQLRDQGQAHARQRRRRETPGPLSSPNGIKATSNINGRDHDQRPGQDAHGAHRRRPASPASTITSQGITLQIGRARRHRPAQWHQLPWPPCTSPGRNRPARGRHRPGLRRARPQDPSQPSIRRPARSTSTRSAASTWRSLHTFDADLITSGKVVFAVGRRAASLGDPARSRARSSSRASTSPSTASPTASAT